LSSAIAAPRRRRIIESRPRLPSDVVLERRLGLAIDAEAPPSMRVSGREWNRYSSTFLSEIVTCRLDRGAELSFFCKYFVGDHGRRPGEVRHPFYEIDVYRHLLRGMELSLPRFVGAWIDEASGDGLLVIEHLAGLCLNRVSDPELKLVAAAAWAAHFHQAAAPALARPELCFLRRLDRAFFSARLERLLELESGGEHCRWLDLMADRFDRALEVLDGEPTIVHGEFYPMNILIRSDRIYPIDWETAAVGPAELDLATLLEHWPEEKERVVLDAYVEAHGASIDRRELMRRLTAARILVGVNWLAWEPAAETGVQREPESWRFEQLLRDARLLSLV
jgi:hypothetical protein